MNLFLRKSKFVFFILLSALSQKALPQCSVAPNATAGITLQCSSSGTRTGLAYSTLYNLYYSIDAGSSTFPIETFGVTGTPLHSMAQGYDYRGIWWNGNISQLQGNVQSYNGIVNATLDATSHYATGGGTVVYATNSTPDIQSVGDYDSARNYIIYYKSGSIYQYNYATDALANTDLVAGLPVAVTNLTANAVVYTGCSGKEYAVYDYVNKRVYFLDFNGNYVATSQLPATAAQPSAYGIAWGNGLFWVYNTTDIQWHSYNVFASVLPVTLFNINAKYNGGLVVINWSTANEVNISKYILQKSNDAKTFTDAYSVISKTGSNNFYDYSDINVASKGVEYYRLKIVDEDGNYNFSKVVAVSINGKASFFTVTPNPAKAFTTLNFGQPLQHAQIAVYDLSGKKILLQNLESQSSTYSLNVQSLVNGMYIISVKTDKDTFNQKLIISK